MSTWDDIIRIMSIITIEQLKARFEGGDFPGSTDYINLIDTLAALPESNSGNVVLNGAGVPSAGTGANGDFYINTSNYDIYGPKTSGSWGSATSLVGPTGATGSAGSQGATGAAGTNGTNGATGDTGPAGPGVSSGGTTGQYLTKIDGTNYNTQWSTLDLSSKQDVVANVSSTEIGYLDGVTSSIQTQLNDKAPLASPTFTGTVSAAALTLSGDLTVNGTTTTLNSTTLTIDDKNIVLGDTATPSDTTADGGGITLKGATDKTINWSDSTDAWTLSEHVNLSSGKNYLKNGTDIKDVTETLTNKTLTTPKINEDVALTATATELNVLDGITSSTTELNYVDGVTSSIQTQLNAKQAIISGVSDTEIGYLDGVTSAIQTQLNDKASATSISDATTTTAARGAGYMGIPQSAAATTGAYTIVAADAGEHIYSTATRTITIPANGSVAFPIGTAITFIAATGTTVTIAITTDTLILAGTGTTGNRTLAPFGMATAIKITSTSWIISGNGLT